ncbi:MAG: hypothetical protein OSB05_15735 [Akkermansiaceae bacterium]|nr:hypothetical protein [Akkermansiaceae bacterium]
MINPHLPAASTGLGPDHTRRHRAECGERFHKACLELSQSFWQQGKPAQAILQLNKASMVPDLPAPFAALVWYLCHPPEDLFIGNPVRHFQHLASRISGNHAELRSWRAWACFHLSEEILPARDFPRDAQQIKNEQLRIPSLEVIEKNLPTCDSSSLPAAKALVRNHPVTRP